jgi:thioredoxin 1
MQTATNKRESFGEIINGQVPVLVDFYADWCAPCRMMKPILEELHRRMGDKLRILKIDTDKSPAIAEKLQIRGIPTLILFRSGQALWRHSGVVQAAQLEKIVSQYTTNQ